MAELNRSSVCDDPSDWPIDFHELRILDSLLRCSICLEYFDIAVLATECCHNYCSLCARKYITFKPQCPSCPAEMHPKDLKCNRVLDEIVKIFKMIRPRLLTVLQQHASTSNEQQQQPLSCSLSKSPYTQRQSTRKNNGLNTRLTKRTEAVKATGYCSGASEDDFVLQRTQMNTTRSIRNASDFQSDGSSTSTLTESELDFTDNATTGKKNTKEIAVCPVCGKQFQLKQINSHLDFCLGKNEPRKISRRGQGLRGAKQSSGESKIEDLPRTRSSRSSRIASKAEEYCIGSTSGACKEEFMQSSNASHSEIVTEDDTANVSMVEKSVDMKRIASNHLLPVVGLEKRKKLPELVISGLTERQIRAKLKAHGLSSRGDKKTLHNRFKNFITLYNSQCDAVNPMPDIVKEVERRESIRKRLDNKGTTVIHTFDRTKTDEEKEQFGQEYLEKHKTHFDQLIQDVKNRRKKTTTATDGDHCKVSEPKKYQRDSTESNSSVTEEDAKEGQDNEMVDAPGSPTKPILICDDDDNNDTVDGLSFGSAFKGGRESKQNSGKSDAKLSPKLCDSPDTAGKNQALSCKLKQKLESSAKSQQGKSLVGVGKSSKFGSKSIKSNKTQLKSAKKLSSKAKHDQGKGRKELKAKNISSFFEKVAHDKVDTPSTCSSDSNNKRITERKWTVDKFELDDSDLTDMSDDSEMDVDGGTRDVKGVILPTTSDVIAERRLVANPPSPSDLNVFDNQCSETMDF
eukprot:gene6164-6875_t